MQTQESQVQEAFLRESDERSHPGHTGHNGPNGVRLTYKGHNRRRNRRGLLRLRPASSGAWRCMSSGCTPPLPPLLSGAVPGRPLRR